MLGWVDRVAVESLIDGDYSNGLIISIGGMNVSSPMLKNARCEVVDVSSGNVDLLEDYVFPDGCDYVKIVIPETFTLITGGHVRGFPGIHWLDLSHAYVKRIGAGMCREFYQLRMVLLPYTLEAIDADCFGLSSLERLDLSGTVVERVDDSFCRMCKKLREVLLPATLKRIGIDFLVWSSVERVDLSRTSVESLAGGFCPNCRELRELLLPGTLVSFGSRACERAPLGLLFPPLAGVIRLGEVWSASILSGLVGLGSIPARPIWPST
jgi:hypothetical protein